VASVPELAHVSSGVTPYPKISVHYGDTLELQKFKIY